MEDFIKNFANQWDETDYQEFTPNCKFHELEEWSSLVGLAILNMIAKNYGVKIALAELQSAITIEDVYNLIQSKQ